MYKHLLKVLIAAAIMRRGGNAGPGNAGLPPPDEAKP